MNSTQKPTTACPLLNSSLVKAKQMAEDFPNDFIVWGVQNDLMGMGEWLTPSDDTYLDFYIEMTKGKANV